MCETEGFTREALKDVEMKRGRAVNHDVSLGSPEKAGRPEALRRRAQRHIVDGARPRFVFKSFTVSRVKPSVSYVLQKFSLSVF